MSQDPDPIGRDEYVKRIADLCARGGRHPVPRRARDRAILLHALARSFAGGAEHTEKQVDARIQRWLLQTGRALETDHVALRRALVDDGFLAREPRGSAYRSSTRYKGLWSFDPGVSGVDPDAIVAETLVRAAERKRLAREK